MQHGFVDQVVDRREMKERIVTLLNHLLEPVQDYQSL
jgi:acetyl-CoA carboxylase beta subunit